MTAQKFVGISFNFSIINRIRDGPIIGKARIYLDVAVYRTALLAAVLLVATGWP